jgi:hypothetical protein
MSLLAAGLLVLFLLAGPGIRSTDNGIPDEVREMHRNAKRMAEKFKDDPDGAKMVDADRKRAEELEARFTGLKEVPGPSREE